MNRTRTRTHDPQVVENHFASGDPGTPMVNVGIWSRQSTERMDDRINPGYFRAQREGKLLPVAPMAQEQKLFTFAPGSWDLVARRPQPPFPDEVVILKGDGLLSAGNLPTLLPAPSVDYDEVLQEALGRARQRAFDALTFLAEFRKTIELVLGLRARAVLFSEKFISRVGNWRRYDPSLVREKLIDPLGLAQLLSEVWLEMRYGWRPIVYDMLSIQEMLNRPLVDPDKIYRGYGTQTSELTDVVSSLESAASTPSFSFSMQAFRFRYTEVQSSTLEVRGAVGVGLNAGSNIQFDPLQTAWELIPYSFILDWFVTIGDALAAFSPFAESTGKFSTASWVIEQQTSRTVTPEANTAGFWIQEGSATPGTDIYTKLTKARIPEQPQPTLGFDVDLDAGKIIDLIAIFGLQNLRLFRRLNAALLKSLR